MSKKSKGGTRGTIYLEVAKIRLVDAQVLLENKRHHGAVYLAGYSVECALKWAITRRNEQPYLPSTLETHDLQKLIEQTGLIPEMRQDLGTWTLFSALVDEWGPHGRYETKALDARAAARLYKQIKQVYSWITEHAV
ncbi:MAG: HEPN domain-containing protein [Luteolibacter sp.]